MTEREAQTQKLLRYMEAGNAVTQRIATSKFDCYRLGARMYDLKAAGVPVRSGWEYKLDENGKVVKKWKKYWIAKQ